MKLLFITILIFSASLCFGQNKIIKVSFLKENGKYVNNQDSADYFRTVSLPDSGSVLYNITEYYKNGKTRLIGKTSSIDPPAFKGQCATFYKSGKRQSIKNYKNGLEVGDQFYFFPNGKLYLQTEYPDNRNVYNTVEQNFLIKANNDSLGTALVEDGNGNCKIYDEKFTYIEEEGAVKNGEREDLWKGTNKLLEITYTENYKNNVLIEGTSVGKDGKAISYVKQGEPPQFKGGLQAFGLYLARAIQYPQEDRQNNVQGKVIVSFMVDKEGKVSNVTVERPVSPGIDAEAVRVIKNSPRWKPGKRFGREVSVLYAVPINFTLSQN